MGESILGIEGILNAEALRGMPYPRHLTLMSLGVLMSLGDMSYRHPSMNAQEAISLPPLLKTTQGETSDCY